MVRGDGQGPRALPLLQGRESRPDGGTAHDVDLRLAVDIDRIMAELDAPGGPQRCARPGRDPRCLYRGRPGGAGLRQGPLRRSRPVGSRGSRSAIRSPGGKGSAQTWLRSERARTSTRSRTPADSTARSESSAVWRRSAHCAVRASEPSRPIELLMFTSEEPTRFGDRLPGQPGTLREPSRPESLAALRDAEGRTLRPDPPAAGFRGELATVRLPAGYFAAFVELHIEQGPVARASRRPDRHRHGHRGPGGAPRDAGGRGRPRRRGPDARPDATPSAPRRRRCWRSRRLPCPAAVRTTVATTGVCRVHPGAINSIPDRVTLEIDVRDIDLATARPCP